MNEWGVKTNHWNYIIDFFGHFFSPRGFFDGDFDVFRWNFTRCMCAICPCVELKLTFFPSFCHQFRIFRTRLVFWQIEFSCFFSFVHFKEKLKIVHFSVSIVVELAVCLCMHVCVDDWLIDIKLNIYTCNIIYGLFVYMWVCVYEWVDDWVLCVWLNRIQ